MGDYLHALATRASKTSSLRPRLPSLFEPPVGIPAAHFLHPYPARSHQSTFTPEAEHSHDGIFDISVFRAVENSYASAIRSRGDAVNTQPPARRGRDAAQPMVQSAVHESPAPSVHSNPRPMKRRESAQTLANESLTGSDQPAEQRTISRPTREPSPPVQKLDVNSPHDAVSASSGERAARSSVTRDTPEGAPVAKTPHVENPLASHIEQNAIRFRNVSPPPTQDVTRPSHSSRPLERESFRGHTDEPRPVHIVIERLTVQASVPQAAPPTRSAPLPRPKTSLDQYLHERGGRRP